MTPLARGFFAAVLLGIAAFCAFGFLATFEPPGFIGWRVFYTVAGGLCLLAVGWIASRR
jgi:hypothetical protein